MVWKESGQFVSEPIFVPRNMSSSNIGLPTTSIDENLSNEENCCKPVTEDDGVVIFTLLSSALQKYVQVMNLVEFKSTVKMLFWMNNFLTYNILFHIILGHSCRCRKFFRAC